MPKYLYSFIYEVALQNAICGRCNNPIPVQSRFRNYVEVGADERHTPTFKTSYDRYSCIFLKCDACKHTRTLTYNNAVFRLVFRNCKEE